MKFLQYLEGSYTHFLKSVTQCCPPSGMIVRSACHWLTHSFKILACLLLADTVVSCQSVSQLSHQPRPVHWTCSVATWIVRSSGTNFPSHFIPKIKSVRQDQRCCVLYLGNGQSGNDCLTIREYKLYKYTSYIT